MDTIKVNTCEEYVVVELINEKSKNERLFKEIEELKEQNEKLMNMFKKKYQRENEYLNRKGGGQKWK